MKEIRLFNDYEKKMGMRPTPQETPKKDPPPHPKQVTFYGDNQNRFDEMVEVYETIARRKTDVVYHYLWPAEKTVLNSYEAKKYIEQETIRGGESNFDVPLFVSLTKIPVIGIGPSSDSDLIQNPDAIGRWCTMVALYQIQRSPQKQIAVIMDNIHLEQNAELIRETIPNATFRFSEYEEIR